MSCHHDRAAEPHGRKRHGARLRPADRLDASPGETPGMNRAAIDVARGGSFVPVQGIDRIRCDTLR